jgi:hypothetical protein
MYLMSRNQSGVWVFNSLEDLWHADAVQHRINWNSPKSLEETVKILESSEAAEFGPIRVWKCHTCTTEKKCEWRRRILYTSNLHQSNKAGTRGRILRLFNGCTRLAMKLRYRIRTFLKKPCSCPGGLPRL